MDFQGKVTGEKQVLRVMQNMPRSSQRKIYMQSLRDGAKVVREAATRNLRQQIDNFTGVAARAGTVRVYNLKKLRGNFRVSVNVKKGLLNTQVKDKDGAPVRVGLYLSVLEYGSVKLKRRPRPWIRPALTNNKYIAISLVRKGVASRLNDALKDAGSKNA